MKKVSVLLGVLCLGSVSANAAQYGIGASLKDRDYAVYFPIAVSKSVTVEPYIDFYTGKRRVLTETDQYKFEGKKIGLGFFKSLQMHEDSQVYLGLRLALLKHEYEREYQSSDDMDEEHNYYSQSQSEGYAVEPVIGIAYEIATNLSIAAEAKYEYQKYESDYNNLSTSSDVGAEDSQATSSYAETGSRLIIRYYF